MRDEGVQTDWTREKGSEPAFRVWGQSMKLAES